MNKLRRLNLRLTAEQHEELVALGEVLGERTGAVATRLVQGRLANQPVANMRLKRELSNAKNNIQQLQALFPTETAHPLHAELQALWERLGDFELEVLEALPDDEEGS
jgi:hypothetical protein